MNEYLLKTDVPLMLEDSLVRELCYSCKGLCTWDKDLTVSTPHKAVNEMS